MQMNPAKAYEKHPPPFHSWPDQDKFFVWNAIEVLNAKMAGYPTGHDLTIMVPRDSHDAAALNTLIRRLGFSILDRAKFAVTDPKTPEHLRHYGQYNAPPDKPAYVLYWQLKIIREQSL